MPLAMLLAGVIVPTRPPASQRIYSDLCTEVQSGDVSSHQIILTGPSDHLKAMFYWSEGAVMTPLEAASVSAAGYKIKIVFRGSEGTARFTGAMHEDYLQGNVRDFGRSEWMHVLLRRRTTEAKIPPACAILASKTH